MKLAREKVLKLLRARLKEALKIEKRGYEGRRKQHLKQIKADVKRMQKRVAKLSVKGYVDKDWCYYARHQVQRLQKQISMVELTGDGEMLDTRGLDLDLRDLV